MNRRHFFKVAFSTPLLAPFVLASKTTKSDMELFLISDEPQLFIPFLLGEMEKYVFTSGRSMAFHNQIPQAEMIERVLEKKGWKSASRPGRADLTLSFRSLHQKALQSFTLVREGRVWDVRTRKLLALWEEMSSSHRPSSLLTIASFRKRGFESGRGKRVNIYREGIKIDSLSLQGKSSRSFTASRGVLTVEVEKGKAWVSDSSCRHKICLYTPPVSLAGERIICAPSRMLLEVEGRSGVDTVVG
ncbi:MAG: NusG domain II-containing protein [Candidatus Aminicenantales bacterium]